MENKPKFEPGKEAGKPFKVKLEDTNPFKSGNYAVGITGQGMATGDYFTVTNKTINGFDVAFFNSSNSGVSKTFDFIAKGF